jgi:uncharacterized protein
VLIVLSPAKTLDEATHYPAQLLTQPRFMHETQQLLATLKTLDEKAVATLMHISPKLAALNYERFQNFPKNLNETNAKPAAYMFRGDVYDGLDIDTLPTSSLAFMGAHLRVISGLYGVLRPFDFMFPYRLEMGTKLAHGGHKNLYQFWGSTIAEALNADARVAGTDVLLNLASVEYAGAIDRTALKLQEIAVHFKEKKGNQLKIVALFAKRARGRMARFVVENGLSNPADLRTFALDGYRFDKDLSSETALTFVRG